MAVNPKLTVPITSHHILRCVVDGGEDDSPRRAALAVAKAEAKRLGYTKTRFHTMMPTNEEGTHWKVDLEVLDE